ncbi:MAG: nicotinate-nucleotide adenylyltransferase [Nitrospirota bacterium]
MPIGLFGGTFNPIHNGHLVVARRIFSLLKLSRILFIPAKSPPHKQHQEIAKDSDRVKMVALAISDYPDFALCDIEIKRQGLSYTIDTILSLKKTVSNETFVFILGTDTFVHMASWKEPEALLELCSFVIVPRAGFPFSRLPSLKAIEGINKRALMAMDRNERRSYTYRLSGTTRLYFRNIPWAEVSATKIRAGIHTNKNTECLLPKSVMSYIIERGLYK